MITNENIQKFKNYGLVLTPVNKTNDIKDKSPVVKNGSWSADWTDQELLDANRLGAFHKESGIYDIDFDDKSLRANKFIDLLPRTLTIGKKVNGAVVATHKIYKLPEDVKFKSYNYPKAAKKGETIVETLAGTQTIIAGVDRVIIDNVEPAVLDPAAIDKDLRMIVAFSELLKHTIDIDQRNHFYFRLGGALASQTDIPMDMRLKYVEKLCDLTNDDEVKNRLSCIERQQNNYENGKECYSIKELSDFLNTNLKGFDEIKKLNLE